MPFPDEIGAKLVSAGVGTLDTSIFKGSKAPVPGGDGPYLSLIETGGSRPARTQNNTATERPSMQLVARARSPQVARIMLKAAYDALGGADGLYNVTLSGTIYLSITAAQGLTDIGEDANGRFQVAFNIDTEKQPS